MQLQLIQCSEINLSNNLEMQQNQKQQSAFTHQATDLKDLQDVENYLLVNSFCKNAVLYQKKLHYASRKYKNNTVLKNHEEKRQSETRKTGNKSASVVNLEFQEGKKQQNLKGMRKFIYRAPVAQKKSHFNTIQDAPRNLVSIYKESSKSKYRQLFKESIDEFFKNTVRIGPCAKSILNQKDATNNTCRQLSLKTQKINLPFHQTKNSNFRNKTVYNSVNKTYRKDRSQSKAQSHQRVKSFIENQSNLFPDQLPIKRPKTLNKLKKASQIQGLIPVRKPKNRKDYFVFGLADKNCTAQSKIQMYRDLLWKVNYSNCLYVFTPQQIPTPSQTYKFYVGPGNNCNLIKGILKRRFWWSITTNKNEEGINFMWTQLKYNAFFRQQKPNQLLQLGDYQKKLRNLQQQANQETQQQQLKQMGKLFSNLDMVIWRNHYLKHRKSQISIQQNTYKRRLKLYDKKPIQKIQNSTLLRMHNHLETNFYIGNKKALFYNIKRFYELQNKDPFKIIPYTFHIKKGMDDNEWKRFLHYFNQLQTMKKNNKHFKNMWIVKPGENTNRGNGISVCFSLDDIKIRINGRERNRDGQLRTFIIQKYIQNPMLYHRRKFDIRHYALITCINGVFKFYWYEEGYIRTSSSEYNLKVNRNPLIHLTNDAIQKNTSDYGKYEKGNKLSYQEFQKYLQTTYPENKYNLFEEILPKIKNYAAQAFKASYSILDEKRLENNFELLGLDFMIDEDFEPWLIQINTNPCLELSSPLLCRMIPHLIQNTMRICLDPLFPPPQNWPANKKTFFGQQPLKQNKFCVVFDQRVHGQEIQQIFKGEKKIDQNMGKIQEDDQIFEDQGLQDWEEKN